jgi:hypothetical protein
MLISSNKIPPAVLSAAREIPIPASRNFPSRAKTSRIAVAITIPRMAMERRSEGEDVAVKAANIAATSIGATVAKNVARAMPAISNISFSNFAAHHSSRKNQLATENIEFTEKNNGLP